MRYGRELEVRRIAIVTRDFAFYQTLVGEMRSRRLSFTALSPGEAIPQSVGAVITTDEEADGIEFDEDRIVIARKPGIAIDRALELLRGRRRYSQIIIGIDPGKRPGIAVLGDNTVVAVHQTSASEAHDIVEQIVDEYIADRFIIRVGHGARLIRNQIVNAVINLGIPVELVDENGTTPRLGKGVHGSQVSDIVAAINIAKIKGEIVGRQNIEPTLGEVKEIQSLSRQLSGGHSTIPMQLARRVAKGEITIYDAITRHGRRNQI